MSNNLPVRPSWIYGPETKPVRRRRTVILSAATVAALSLLAVLTGCDPDPKEEPKPAPIALVAASAPLSTPAASKAPKDFCATLSTRDMALCRLIEAQPAYGTIGADGSSGESPNGKAIIKEIASQNLPKNEVRMYLEGEYEAFTYHYRGDTYSMDVRDLPSKDCHFELGWKDKDGKPGGLKLVETKIVCP